MTKGRGGAAAAAQEEETSGSDALVSDSGEEGEEEEEDEEAPQLPAPDDGEGSDFDELQARRRRLCPPAGEAHHPRSGGL